jgi:D-alanyl-D-alanine carboxypeptidase
MASSRHIAQIGAAMAIGMAMMTASADANPVLLFEPATGRVLYAEEPDRLWYPASVTKLMTVYLTFDAVKVGRLAWDDDVPLSDHARAQPATRIGLRAGIKLNVEQAVRGLILRSANDFAVALAERVGGTEEAFVRAMNDTAKRLGMTRTVFRNPHGLPDEEQVTTARDLATLTTALFRDFPDRAEVFSTPTVRIHKGTFYSQNDLLRTLEGADGMKTGFTCASGYNVVASATRDGHRLVAIVLGEYNRQRRSARATELIDAGFAHLLTDPALMAAVVVPAAAPIKLRHASASATVTPQPFVPVTLRSLPLAPVEAGPPGNIGRELRTRTCRGYSGFTKPEPEHDPEDEHDHPATSSIAKPKPATGKITHAHSVDRTHRAKPTAAVVRKSVARKPPKVPAAPSVEVDAHQGTASVLHPLTGDKPYMFGN